MDVFNYTERKLEYVPCNLCGSSDFSIIERRSVNGLDVHTVICRVCSLIYINPRMSKADYNEYYLKSFYRQDRAAIKNKEFVNYGLDKNFENARRFGQGIMTYMGKYVRDGLTIDVGSSTGGILYGMKEKRPSLNIHGIEPSFEEGSFAQAKGVPTTVALFEDADIGRLGKAANILCVQSLNHLLDPMKFLRWAHQTLEDDGHVFLAVKNWRHQVRRMGRLASAVQIDHVYMFTPESLSLLCTTAGFDVVYTDIDEGKSHNQICEQKSHGLNTHHIRIVARKSSARNAASFSKKIYLKTRIVLWPPFVKMVYIFRYSRRLAFVRKMLHI